MRIRIGETARRREEDSGEKGVDRFSQRIVAPGTILFRQLEQKKNGTTVDENQLALVP